MSSEKEELLDRINKNLYEIKYLVNFYKKDFDGIYKYNYLDDEGHYDDYDEVSFDSFLETLEVYSNNIFLLNGFSHMGILNSLDESLEAIVKSYEDGNFSNCTSNIYYLYKYKESFFPNLSDKKPKKESLAPTFHIESTFLDSIKIKNYFSLKDIEITDLKDKKEIYFVGENGDGKTILLQAILLALKKEYSIEAGNYIKDIKELMVLSAKVDLSEYTNGAAIVAVGELGFSGFPCVGKRVCIAVVPPSYPITM